MDFQPGKHSILRSVQPSSSLHRNHPRFRILLSVLLTFFFWGTPTWAQVLLEQTQTGAELLTNPDIVFHQGAVQVVGDAIEMNSTGLRFLFEWSVAPPAARGTVIAEVAVDYEPLTADNDPAFGFHDGASFAGLLRSDNLGGSLFTSQGAINGINIAAALGPLGPEGIDPLEPFTVKYIIPSGGGSVPFEFTEGADRHSDEFFTGQLDSNNALTFFMAGGSQANERYRIHSMTLRVTEVGVNTDGLVYFPLPNCGVVNTTNAVAGKLDTNELRTFSVRGEMTDLSSQGGSATGCGVPDSAEAVVANFWVYSHDGNGKLRVGASGKSLGAGVGTLIRYNETAVESYTNATVLDLCDNDACTSDFQVRAQGNGSKTHLSMDVMGYFAPLDMASLTTIQTTESESLTVTGPGGLDLDGGDLDLAGGDLDLEGGNFVQTPGSPQSSGSASSAFTNPAIAVSGRYAYGVGEDNRFTVFDIQSSNHPVVVSNLTLMGKPTDIAVAEPYAFVTLQDTGEVKVLDIADPHAPVEVGSLSVPAPTGLVVSGAYAYVVGDSQLNIVDIADPANPRLVGADALLASGPTVKVALAGDYLYIAFDSTLAKFEIVPGRHPFLEGEYTLSNPVGRLKIAGDFAYLVDDTRMYIEVVDLSIPMPSGVVVLQAGPGELINDLAIAGRYLFVGTTDGLQIVDILDPLMPALIPGGGFLSIASGVHSLVVGGPHAYGVSASGLSIFELSHGDFLTAVAHSLEAGQLRVRNDVAAEGDLRVMGGVQVGTAGLSSDGSISTRGMLELGPIAPNVPGPNGVVRLFAQDMGGTLELRAQDGAGNVTTLSPHNFSLIGEASEPMAWSYFSENAHGRINVDMLRVVRLLEELSGEKLVHLDWAEGVEAKESPAQERSLRQHLEELQRELEELKASLGSK